MKSFVETTHDYETWLAGFVKIDPIDLATKHRRMADPQTAFPFFRATYYRWIEQWNRLCPELSEGPEVPSVGDLHVENFGTWRDGEGRLAWGVNDFDECGPLAYAQDLVRLTASALLAARTGELETPRRGIAESILRGYRKNLKRGGMPFVLNGPHPTLRAMATSKQRDPARFWKTLECIADANPSPVPADATDLLTSHLPRGATSVRVFPRRGAGLGSLGKPRYVAIAEWEGGRVGREIKGRVPPATIFHADTDPDWDRHGATIALANRCHDPFFKLLPGWVARRLTPDCSRIDMAGLQTVNEVGKLLSAMGREVANVHLGEESKIEAIQNDLDRRPTDWLEKAAKRMLKAVVSDWEEWKERSRKVAPVAAR